MLTDEETMQRIWSIENAYFLAMTQARVRTTEQILTAWKQLENWRDADIASWKTRAARTQNSANLVSARLTVGKIVATQRAWGLSPERPRTALDVRVSSLRPGLSDDDPFQSIANELYYNLSEGKRIKDALLSAENRIDVVSKSLFQEAAIKASNTARSPRVTGLMRVLSGSNKHCELCLLAASRVYAATDRAGNPRGLEPIHNRCSCAVREIYDNIDSYDFDTILGSQQNLPDSERRWLLENTSEGSNLLDAVFEEAESLDLEIPAEWR